jgi:hypothetical protein
MGLLDNLWKKEITDEINVVKHKCRKCGKFIPVYNTRIPTEDLNKICKCEEPEWYSYVELVKVYGRE